jgi:hypothetical protein
MLKKTLIAASLAAATSTAFAGDITVSGTAYKVGNEYLNSYTGSALEGDLDAQAIGIAYDAGIALGVDNTLKFVFAGGAIEADTGLKLHVRTADIADHPTSATILADAIDALDDVTEAAPADTAADLAALKAAAIAVIVAAEAADRSVDGSATKVAVAAVPYDTDFATTKGDVATALGTAIDSFTGGGDVADLVDFGVDANGDYEWVLFKMTSATLVTDTLFFNETNGGGDFGSNVVAKFTKSTIGAGDLTVAMPEAKDGTGANLAAPVASAKTLVTTANQFAVTATTVEDTIDVEQDRLYFVDAAAAQDTTGTFTFDVTEDGTIDLGLDADAAEISFEISGTLSGVDSVDLVDLGASNDSAAFDEDNLVEGTGIHNANITVTVDGKTNLATRTLGLSVMVTPAEADTDAFYMLGAANSASDAFEWDLNGSEITFPYAPIGYDHITTNFELANSGDQEGDVLITAFTREGMDYSGTLTAKAMKESLTKISETEIMEALGLTEGTSLSITFSTTAPDADIKITGYSNIADKGGRMTLLSTAYEGESDKISSCSGTSAADGVDYTITCN